MTVHLDTLDYSATAHVLGTSHLQIRQHEGTLGKLVERMELQGIHTDFVLVEDMNTCKGHYKLTWSKDSYALILLKKGVVNNKD